MAAGFFLISACQASNGAVSQASPSGAIPSPSPLAITPSPSSIAQSTPGAVCTNITNTGYQTGQPSASWSAPRDAPSVPIKSMTLSGDTLTFAFVSGTPEWRLDPNTAAPGFNGANGQPITLPGSAGEYLTLVGFGRNPPTGDPLNYLGPQSVSSNGPNLLQVYEIFDAEGQIQWAIALSSRGCAIVTSTDSNLSFQFVASPQ